MYYKKITLICHPKKKQELEGKVSWKPLIQYGIDSIDSTVMPISALFS